MSESDIIATAPHEPNGATPEDRACVIGRQPFGRISIANADAAGSSHTDAAIEQAYRAVREVVESRAAEYVSRFTSS